MFTILFNQFSKLVFALCLFNFILLLIRIAYFFKQLYEIIVILVIYFRSLSSLNIGDFVIVSSDDSRFLGIELATVASVEGLNEVDLTSHGFVSPLSDYKNYVFSLISTR